ncbi:hypothetical protein [Methanolobus chelungpuianus]|nr:hypothetical protein [Methanolobus chelungpuianus]
MRTELNKVMHCGPAYADIRRWQRKGPGRIKREQEGTKGLYGL